MSVAIGFAIAAVAFVVGTALGLAVGRTPRPPKPPRCESVAGGVHLRCELAQGHSGPHTAEHGLCGRFWFHDGDTFHVSKLT